MKDYQWKLLVRFMRFTIKMLYRVHFQSIIGPATFDEFEETQRQFLRDTDEWL